MRVFNKILNLSTYLALFVLVCMGFFFRQSFYYIGVLLAIVSLFILIGKIICERYYNLERDICALKKVNEELQKENHWLCIENESLKEENKIEDPSVTLEKELLRLFNEESDGAMDALPVDLEETDTVDEFFNHKEFLAEPVNYTFVFKNNYMVTIKKYTYNYCNLLIRKMEGNDTVEERNMVKVDDVVCILEEVKCRTN